MVHDRTAASRAYSLPEIHGSVPTSEMGLWKRMFAFAGPAYLVSVGYMDPGNWATDLEGGARFGYRLLWVLLASNLIALLLQTLSSRLGIVTRRDLAQACRDEYPRAVGFSLWILTELAIVACDLAEVLGAAIGLNLLFHLPLLLGVVLTAADTLLVLWFTRMGIRVVEAFVLMLIATIAICFSIEIYWAHPNVAAIASGFLPTLNNNTIFLAVAIFGATVMPHNLYLHSALVQTRQIGETFQEKRRACRFNLLDSTLALNGAFFVNAAILIMASAVFFSRGVVVTEIQQAHQLLTPLMGTTAASVLFGAALLCSGQSSTLTGTMAGQIVMEGFLQFRMQPWMRRSITRLLAITPAVLTIYFFGDKATTDLIVLSQVVLNLQLPFAVIPLIHFTSDRDRMGPFSNTLLIRVLAWACAALILFLNIWLLWGQLAGWNIAHYRYAPLIVIGLVVAGAAFTALLLLIAFWPVIHPIRVPAKPVAFPTVGAAAESSARAYERILVPLDHSAADAEAIGSALALARLHHSTIILLHVEEGVTSRMYGAQSSTAEIEEGHDYLTRLVESLAAQQVPVRIVIRHGKSPAHEIASTVAELNADIVVMASHGHTGIKDLIFGTTINSVRHRIGVPLLIVRRADNIAEHG